MDAWIRDLRFAARLLGKAPRQTAFVLLVLAMAFGGNTAMFALLDALVLRPLAVPGADRLVMFTALDDRGARRLIPLTTIAELERRQQSFEVMAGYTSPGVFAGNVRGAAVPVTLETMAGSFYELMGARPALGRLLTHDESMPGSPDPAVAVISHDYWQREFQGDAGVIGQTIHVQNVPISIVGVTEAGFEGLYRDVRYPVMAPLRTTALFAPVGDPRFGVRIAYVLARLKPRVSLETARAELQTLWPQAIEATMPDAVPGPERRQLLAQSFDLKPFTTGFSVLRDRHESALRGASWLTGAVLALAAVNVGGLLLARASVRRRELWIRARLGARRRDVVRQFVAEAVVWSLAAGALAWPLGWWLSRTLASALWVGRSELTLSFVPGLRGWLLIGGSLAGMFAVLVLAPLWVGARRSGGAHPAAARTTSAHAAGRFGKSLLVVQLAGSVALLFVAAVVAKSFTQLLTAPAGWEGNQVQLVSLSGQAGAYRTLQEAVYYPQLVETLRGLPGVQAVGLTRWFSRTSSTLGVPPDPIAARGAPPESGVDALVDYFSPGVFDALRIRLISGRDFTWADTTSSPPVAIVTSDVANRLFPGGDALGQQISIGRDPIAHAEIVGVVAPFRPVDVRLSHSFVLRPSLQRPAFARLPTAVVRADPPLTPDAVQRAVVPLGREYPLSLQSLHGRRDEMLARERVSAFVALATAGLSLLLAASGVYSLLAWLLGQRTQELGIRAALGASEGRLRRSILGEAAMLACLGVAIGLPTAWAAGRWLGAVFPDLTVSSPAAMIGSAAVLGTATLAAAFGPARRAARTDPAAALRAQ